MVAWNVFLLLVASCFFVTSEACANVTAMEVFDPHKYIGLWFEIQKLENAFEKDGICVTAEYAVILDEPFMMSVNHSVYVPSVDQYMSIDGFARQEDHDSDSGKLLLSYPTILEELQYWVLDTDYSTFAIVWSCPGEIEMSWVLGRQRTLAEETVQLVNDVLARNNLNSSDFILTSQEGCP